MYVLAVFILWEQILDASQKRHINPKELYEYAPRSPSDNPPVATINKQKT